MKYLTLGLVALLFLCGPARAQSMGDLILQAQKNNDALADRVTSLEADVAALKAQVFKRPDFKTATPSVPRSCPCGCVTTGTCTCPNCNYGCNVDQKISPWDVPISPSLYPSAKLQLRQQVVCGPNGCPVVNVPVPDSRAYQYVPPQYYVQASSSSGAGTGGCKILGRFKARRAARSGCQ